MAQHSREQYLPVSGWRSGVLDGASAWPFGEPFVTAPID
jgi:hypothetical protein